ncbi:TetR/AcrR family transcriptional regulator [Lactiplantibacillus plantarum]|uniref:TetR/AcrR family transcriptional regulator n=1 Tax=Lactiplantibacillus plantarum TaxID=1590 RepID=UPI000975E134|nr:TetR/AcrR family transcriptional regulator [Lactiplantibacillus plantarum]MBP5841754.1 TetR/AcrR family transcriptional regulator [Lactiplantibacillus plantarum]MCT3214435.1 TetR/AcrR family transcriptional regulator [Lactiplantibacillus plantarum]MCT3269913.1 TetR/AcrR family transcriptional regulator [Lactiplantibacillus plantarum]
MNKSDKRVLKTDYLIKKTFLALLNQKEIDQITIKSICDKALISKSTFYDHYTDKYTLLDTLVSEYAQNFKSEIHSRFKSVSEDRTLQVIEDITNAMSSESQNISSLLKIKGQHGLNIRLRTILRNESFSYFSNHWINNSFSKVFLSELYTEISLGSISFILTNHNNPKMLKQHADFVEIIQEALITKINSKNTEENQL